MKIFNYRNYTPIHWIIIHFFLAAIVYAIPFLSKFWGIIPILYGGYDISKNRNDKNQAAYWAAYYTGLEVLLRIAKGTISYEFGKYAIVLFLLLGILVEREKYSMKNVIFIFYLLCLIPSLFILELPDEISLRKQILFNLSGPISLFVASYYFSVRVFSKEELMNLLWWFLLPIITTSFILYFITPDFNDIKFNTSSNFQTSGGFGPNQVSTILGFGFFLFIFSFLLKRTFSGYFIVDLFLAIHILFRALLTFSRGGIFVAFIGIFLCFLLLFFYGKIKINKSIFIAILIMPIVLYQTWVISNNITGGLLENRYQNKNVVGREKSDITAGRVDIFLHEIEAFIEYPFLGVGPGGAKYYRISRGKVSAASHNEIGRMFSEHGVFGIIGLLLLLLYPSFKFIKTNIYTKVVLIGFIGIAFLTFNHAAMRTAMAGFVYGLGLLTINWKEDE